MDTNTPLQEAQISPFCSLQQQHMSHLVISGKDRWNFIVKSHLGTPDSCVEKGFTNLCEEPVSEEEQYCLEFFFVPFVPNTCYI